jgi:hypothetical protein
MSRRATAVDAAKPGGVEKRSFKDFTFGEVLDFINILKNYWLVVVAVASLIYAALTHFASADELKRQACISDRRALQADSQASFIVKTSEKASYSNQQTNLYKLKDMLREIQLHNKLDVTSLVEQIDRLIDAAKQSETKADEAATASDLNLRAALKAVGECGKDGK